MKGKSCCLDILFVNLVLKANCLNVSVVLVFSVCCYVDRYEMLKVNIEGKCISVVYLRFKGTKSMPSTMLY